jgi:TIR domain/Domain of unknown function (DUF4062)
MVQKQVLRIVVASPSDVQAERNLIEEIAAELNRGIASARGLVVEITRWETDAFPGFHDKGPQALIDSVLRIEDCDLLIGIFWKRFGKPVSDAKSGTEHEFRAAYEAWKRNKRPQIMVYFNQKPYTPTSRAEIEQWGQVLDFKHDFPGEGLWWTYNGESEFERLVRSHLTQFVLRFTPVPEPTSATAAGNNPPSPDATKTAAATATGSISSSTSSKAGIEVFFLYADEDKELVAKFERHLAAMEKQGLITTWSKAKMTGGGDVEEIGKHLDSAQIILLMISPDFMTSFYLDGTEVEQAMEKRKMGTLVIPILLQPTDYKNAPFERLMPLPMNRRPVTEWSNRESALYEIAVGLRKVVNDLKPNP